MLDDILGSFLFAFDKLRFGGDQRRMFYAHLAMLLRNGMNLPAALTRLLSVYSFNGSKPNRVKALVAKECIDGLASSDTIPDSLMDWIPYDEHATIAAGLKGDGGIEKALGRASELVKRKAIMRSVLSKKLSYPAIQAVALCALLYYISKKALPQILQMTDKSHWDFTAYAMDVCATVVGDYGSVLLVVMLVIAGFTIWSINNLTGSARLWLERIPPWSIVRRTRGATFFYNYGLLQFSGEKGLDILKGFLENANPYMAERINGAIKGVKNGKNIGDALYLAGYEFPSREAVEFVRAIAGLEGGHESMMTFASEWMDQTVEEVSILADTMALLVQLANFATIAFVLAGSSSIGGAALGGI